MEDDTVRRSGRKRQSSQRYLENTEEAFGLDDDDRDSNMRGHLNDGDEPVGDEDFVPAAMDIDDEIDDTTFAAEAEGEDGLDEEADLDSDDQDEKLDSNATPRQQKTPNSQQLTTKLARSERQSRGLLDYRMGISKEAVMFNLFGPAAQDQQPALQANYRWQREPILPSRRADRGGFGSYHRSFNIQDSARTREIHEDWKWYDVEGGREVFKSAQQMSLLEIATALQFMNIEDSPLEVVMGPFGQQQKHSIPPLHSVDLNTAFNNEDSPGMQKSKRNGILLNAGERVNELSWAPNQPGDVQFLAVTTQELQENPQAAGDGSDHPPSAFRPIPHYKSAIQIWQVNTGSDNRIDLDRPPQLRLVICTSWGTLRRMKWCPCPRKATSDNGGGKHLGLLAGVWSDGHVRVIDVTVPPSSSCNHPSAQYLQITNAAFASRPPSGVFTCLTWLSAHSICAGTADGYAAVYSLPTALHSTDPTNATPLVYAPLQSTYLTDLTSCYPSRPHMLVSSAMSGHLSLTDLSRSSPVKGFSTILNNRSRVGRINIAWYDWTQCIVSVDDNFTLQAHPLRRFYGSTGASRFKSHVVKLAVSEVHPCLVAADTAGDVTFTNPLRRLLRSKTAMWNLRWFNHTWRRSEMPDTTIRTDVSKEEAEAMKEHIQPSKLDRGDKGLIRIVEGFAAESVSIHKTAAPGHGKAFVEGAYATTHEARTAATSVAWNPNIHVGGWIAAGSATGLIRIEDVGMDEPK